MSYQQEETRYFPAKVQLLLGSANLPVITLAFHRIIAGKGAFRTSASLTRSSHGHVLYTSCRLHTRADLRMRSYRTVKGVASERPNSLSELRKTVTGIFVLPRHTVSWCIKMLVSSKLREQ